MITFYEYDPSTFEFTKEITFDPSTLKDLVIAIPGIDAPIEVIKAEVPEIKNTTKVAPPAATATKTPVFDVEAGTWSLKSDYRTKEYFDTTTGDSVFLSLGQKPGKTHTLFAKPGPDYVWVSGEWAKSEEAVLRDASNSVRAERDALLMQADILVNIAEDTGGNAASVRAYRQALRDIPEQEGFPLNVVWPTPEA